MESKQPSKTSKAIHPKQLYRRPGGLIVTALVVVVGAALALAFLVPKGERVDGSGYQVLYVATGQVYFGKLQNTTGDYVVMDQAYTTQDQVSSQDNTSAQTSIVKVSQQVYGPQDTISIKSDQVIFWQNLRADSKVVQAIESKS